MMSTVKNKITLNFIMKVFEKAVEKKIIQKNYIVYGQRIKSACHFSSRE
jgi:hypothetical protein